MSYDGFAAGLAVRAAPLGDLSVRAHTELATLILHALMHDVLVFPSPASDDDLTRWEEAGWDPELLALRVTQLGDAAVTIPWDHQLRAMWKRAYEQLTGEQRENPAAAYILTAEQLADMSFLTLMGREDDRFEQVALHPPTIHPAFAATDARPRIEKENVESSPRTHELLTPSPSQGAPRRPILQIFSLTGQARLLGSGSSFNSQLPVTPTRTRFIAFSI